MKGTGWQKLASTTKHFSKKQCLNVLQVTSASYQKRCFNYPSATAILTTTADKNEKNCTLSATNPSATQESTLVNAKDIDPKAVTQTNFTVDDRPSTKLGEAGQMVKSVLTIFGIDVMSFNTEQLRQICSNEAGRLTE